MLVYFLILTSKLKLGDIAEALNYLHNEQAIYHGDLKGVSNHSTCYFGELILKDARPISLFLRMATHFSQISVLPDLFKIP
jgi:hypothetical protein